MMVEEPLRRAFHFAALSGPFVPADAFEAAGISAEEEELIEVSATLLAKCEITLAGSERRWLLRSNTRQNVLGEFHEQAELGEAIDWRRRQAGLDGPAEDVLAALEGSGLFEPSALEALLADSAEHEDLARLAVALERAGQRSPAFVLLDRIYAAMDRQHCTNRAEALCGTFEGREEERARLAAWIRTPMTEPPARALFITGLPAIGKSTLLEQAIREARDSGTPLLVVRLDFDRFGLDVRDLPGMTSEVARQVAAQLPATAFDLRIARLRAAGDLGERELKGSSARSTVPSALAEPLRRALQQSQATLLFLLDTLEALLARGGLSHTEQLFVWLDMLLRQGISPMVVIAAGRDRALESLEGRVDGPPIRLDELTSNEGDRLLAQLDVPLAARASVQAMAGGHPLRLRLAAALLKREGRLALRRGPVGAAQLYRSLQSRMSEPLLRAIVQPGLLVRHLDAEVLAKVLVPAAGLPDISSEEAARLFGILKEQQGWLLEPCPRAPGFLRQRREVREMLFPLLQHHRRAPRLHRLAAAWFSRRPEAWAQADGLYHALQGPDRMKLPVDPELAGHFDAEMMAELDRPVRDRIAWARGELSTFLEAQEQPAPDQPVDPRAVMDLQLVLERDDPLEARFLYRRAFESSFVDPISPAADVARAFLWTTGRWDAAWEQLRTRDRLLGREIDGPSEPALLALVLFEMRAELHGATLARRLRREAGFIEAIASLMHRGGKARLRGGALSFLLGAAAHPGMLEAEDPAAAAFALWAGGGNLSAMPESLSYASRAVGERADTLGGKAATDARRLAALSPYAETVRRFVRAQHAPPGLMEHANATLSALREHGWVEAPEPRSDPIETFANGGLLAEWLGMAAPALRDPDLKLISKCAERWRRTVGGLWSYGVVPEAWSGPKGLDAVLAGRVHRLITMDHPVEAARAEYAAWTAAGRPPRRVLRNADMLLEAQGRQVFTASLPEEATAIAAALLPAPAAVVPALAIAIACQTPMWRS